MELCEAFHVAKLAVRHDAPPTKALAGLHRIHIFYFARGETCGGELG